MLFTLSLVGRTRGLRPTPSSASLSGRKKPDQGSGSDTGRGPGGIDWTKKLSGRPSGRDFAHIEMFSPTHVLANREIGALYG